MNEIVFYVALSDRDGTVLSDIIDSVIAVRKKMSESEVIQKVLGHMLAYTSRGCHLDGHIAATLQCEGEPKVNEFRIKIPGGDYLLRVIYVIYDGAHYITSYFIKPSNYEKKEQKDVKKLYEQHIELARALLEKKEKFVLLNDAVQGL